VVISGSIEGKLAAYSRLGREVRYLLHAGRRAWLAEGTRTMAYWRARQSPLFNQTKTAPTLVRVLIGIIIGVAATLFITGIFGSPTPAASAQTAVDAPITVTTLTVW